MTAATVRSKFTIVYVIRSMAVGAVLADSLDRSEGAAVTVAAGDVNVRTAEFELGAVIVIELPKVPGNRVMAGLTVVLEYVFVRIVVEMAGDTLTVGAGEYLSFVTVLAFDVVMLAKQWETCQVVVEKQRFLPVILGVAIVALLALFALMHVIVQMTR